MLTNDLPQNKDEALVHQLDLLAEAFNEPLTANRLMVYVMALSDLSAAQLNHGLNRAVRELTFWPRPAELRELCTGIRARKSDTLPADEAWKWVMTYLDRHWLDARTTWELQGQTDIFVSDGTIYDEPVIREAWMWKHLRQRREGSFATSAPFYILKTYRAPDIPPLIAATLVQLAGTTAGGLRRLSDAREAAQPRDGGGGWQEHHPKDITFLRKDFTENYLNAVTLRAETATQQTLDPSRQLPGEVQSVPIPDQLPINLFIEDEGLHYEVLPLDEAIKAREAGLLDENAFLGAKLYWEHNQKAPGKNESDENDSVENESDQDEPHQADVP